MDRADRRRPAAVEGREVPEGERDGLQQEINALRGERETTRADRFADARAGADGDLPQPAQGVVPGAGEGLPVQAHPARPGVAAGKPGEGRDAAAGQRARRPGPRVAGPAQSAAANSATANARARSRSWAPARKDQRSTHPRNLLSPLRRRESRSPSAHGCRPQPARLLPGSSKIIAQDNLKIIIQCHACFLL